MMMKRSLKKTAGFVSVCVFVCVCVCLPRTVVCYGSHEIDELHDELLYQFESLEIILKNGKS